MRERVLVTRTAEIDDVREINSAIQNTGGPGFYKAMFSSYHLPTLLDSSYMSFVSRIAGHETEENPNLVEGFVTINDCVPLMADPESFEKVVDALKNFIPVTQNNVMFITFWLIAAVSAQIVGSTTNIHHQQKDEVEVAYSIITDIFAKSPHLDFILWICPSNFVLADHIQQMFSALPIDSAEDAVASIRKMFQNFKILFLHRSRFIPKLYVRPARVEDNDDLLPIIEHSNPKILQGQNNHYFLADLIQRADDSNRYFVGLKDNDVPVGMLATGVDVNMALITKIFDVDTYQDLVIQSDNVPLPPPLLISIVGDIRLIDLDVLKHTLDGDRCLVLNFEQMRVDWRQYEHDHALTYQHSKTDSAPSMLQAFIQHVMDNHPHDTDLQAIILWGLPSTEDDAQRLMSLITAHCDVILELVNTSEDAEEDEEDTFLQRHLDAVEILREYFFTEENTIRMQGNYRTPFSNNDVTLPEKRAQWRKISFDKETALQLKNENIQRFYGALSVCFDDRNDRIDRAKQLQQEKPPSANGFAITALCMEDAFLSRSIDLLKLAFEEQPHLAYCLYMVPNDLPPSPATQAFNFVKTRPGVSFDQSLFIIHKSYFYVQEHLRIERIHTTHLKEDSLQAFLNSLSPALKSSLQEEMKISIQENDINLVDNPSQVSFGVMMSDNLIGLLTLSRKILSTEDVNWFRAHYHLDDHISFTRQRIRNQYLLTTWYLDPVFSHWTRLIVQHVMRKCAKSVIYYHTPERDLSPPKEILEDFVFIRPRRRAQGEHQPYSVRPSLLQQQVMLKAAEEDAKANRMPAPTIVPTTIPKDDCPLFCITKNIVAQRKTIVAKRMVIIGGSPHSYSYLETFTSAPNLYYPNVYFVVGVLPSPFRQDLFPSSSSSAEAGLMSSDYASNPEYAASNNRFDDDFSGWLTPKDVEFPLLHELWAMAYPFRINVLKGHMTDIDRDHRAVVISDELVLEYDYLLISTQTVDHSARRIASLSHVHPAKCADAGIFGLGNPSADILAVNWAQRRTANKNDPIVITGGAIKVLTAAEGLIRAGIPASKIIGVTQDYDTAVAGVFPGGTVGADPILHASICKQLADSVLLKTKNSLRAFLWRCEVSEVILSRNGFIQAVDIRALEGNGGNIGSGATQEETKDASPQILRRPSLKPANGANSSSSAASKGPKLLMQKEPCAGLFLCDSDIDGTATSCERDVFAAINDCGLVFDGGVVVDLNFQTVDPHVYAVCDFAKFSRVYRNELPIRRYNPREVGMHVALQLLYRHFYPHLHHLSPSQITQSLRGVTPSAFAGVATSGPTPQLPAKRAVLSTYPTIRFTLGRSFFAYLAGDLTYFHAVLPSMAELDALEYVTDNLGPNIHRFGRPPLHHVTNVKISGLGIFSEFVYLGAEPIEYRNLSQLIGKHEAYLNAAVNAHIKGNVVDWIEFFRDTWATSVYLESFHFLIQAIRRNLTSDKGMISLLGRIFERAERIDEDADVADYRRNIVGPHGEHVSEVTMKTIEASTLDYLRDNADFLPHFYLKSRDQR